MHIRESTIQKIDDEKIIVIVRGVKKEKLIPMAEAMCKGGIKLLEITYSADGSESDEDTAKSVRALTEHFGKDMIIGSGTVLSKEQVALTKQAGGSFIISPDVYEEVIKETVSCGMISIPGAFSPTEIQTAHRAGADFVKLFPVTNMGAEYVKAIRAPLSHIRMLAVGGIDENNMEDYLKCGICGFGIGTNIANKEMIERGDWASLEKLSKRYVDKIKTFG